MKTVVVVSVYISNLGNTISTITIIIIIIIIIVVVVVVVVIIVIIISLSLSAVPFVRNKAYLPCFPVKHVPPSLALSSCATLCLCVLVM